MLPHPGGGVVTVAREDAGPTVLVAVRPNGSVRWISAPPTVDEDESPELIARRPDGLFGPIRDRDIAFSVAPDGSTTTSCRGDVMSDGLCVRVEYRPASVITAEIAPHQPLWKGEMPGTGPDGRDRDNTAIDPGGTAYMPLWHSGGVLALDARTGTERWRSTPVAGTVSTIVGALPDGVLVSDRADNGTLTLRSVSSAGSTRWVVPVAADSPSGALASKLGPYLVDANSGTLAVAVGAPSAARGWWHSMRRRDARGGRRPPA